MKKRKRKGTGISLKDLKQGIMDGTIPSACSDTGATSNAGTTSDPFDGEGVESNKVFSMPTGAQAPATKQKELLLDVRNPAKQVHIVPTLEQTLLSGSKFADAGYTAVYDEDEVNFYEAKDIKITAEAVLRGYRCYKSGLWRVPLKPFVINENEDTLVLDSKCGQSSKNMNYKVPTSVEIREHLQASIERTHDTMNNVYELPSIEQSIRYLHAAAGYPVKSTWLKAIRQGNYTSWPLINVKNVNKHFPESEETQFGHMSTQRQGVRSTKIKDTSSGNEDTPLPKKNDILIRTYDTTDTMYTDQTGGFPTMSSRGNRYQMILYHVDSNSIWVEPTKNKTEGEMIAARSRALDRMRACGIKPKRQVLDNEASKQYRQAIKESEMDYQLVPPEDHRRNVAEKAIQTWKDHFVATLSGTASSFPAHLWCQTIPQMERQLNLLMNTNANPKVCTYTALYGPHDYNQMPFVPIGCESFAHDKPGRRKSFAQHCSKGWVLGTSPEHYRAWIHWTPRTRTTRISATMFFKHKYITNPTVTPADAIVAATTNLENTIKNNLPKQAREQEKLHDLTRLQQILARANLYAQSETNDEPPELLRPDPIQDDDDIEEMPVESAPPPRVPPIATSPRVQPTPTQVATPIFEEIPETTSPAMNTRSRFRTITQESTQDSIFRMIDITDIKLLPSATARRRYPKELLAAVLDPHTGELMEYRHLIANPAYRPVWKPAYGKEIGRLAQGIPGVVEGTDTIIFITKDEIPFERRGDCTYGRIVANYRPEKDDPYRIRICVGGNLIKNIGDCGTPTAGMLTVKILLNSVISTPGAKFMTIDIKNFYLMTPMDRPEFMRLKIDDMPENVIEHYDLRAKATKDGYVYVQINKGMYGLPNAGLIAHELLTKRLNAAGYFQSKMTPGFWKHTWRPVAFSLVVDDFGVKYVGTEHAQHLMDTLNANYETSHEWEGKRYIGLTIDWDYIQRLCHISMPGYCENARQRFKHDIPKKRQDQPHPHIERQYGAKKQYAEPEDTSPALSAKDKTLVQEVIGVFLYYARAVDCTMLPALGSLASQQANPTEKTMNLVKHFLDYTVSNPNATITYRASDMVLAAHSDASYLSETQARSRAGGHFFLSENKQYPDNNGAIITISQIIEAVMSSAAEAELGALFINSQEAVPQRELLEEMGHPQPPTPIQIDNTTALGVVQNNVLKKLKAMDMRYHWLRDRKNQGQFRTHWRAGSTNLADYVTKHHAAIHHKTIRPLYLTPEVRITNLKSSAKKVMARIKTAKAA